MGRYVLPIPAWVSGSAGPLRPPGELGGSSATGFAAELLHWAEPRGSDLTNLRSVHLLLMMQILYDPFMHIYMYYTTRIPILLVFGHSHG